MNKTTVDWLTFRTQGEVLEALEALRPMYGTLGPSLQLEHAPRGSLGFQRGAWLQADGMRIGRFDFGGESQRGWVRAELHGRGCEWVQDWEAVQAVESLPKAEIKRLDVALTTWKGEVTHQRIVAAHSGGAFCAGGRPPNLQQIVHSDPRGGSTCYVGTRAKSDKFFRGYEKGFEIASKCGSMGRALSRIDGCAIEDIYRCEVELKSASRPIPWEVIERRDQYFAGSYPFLAELLPEVECDILMRRPERAPQLDLLAQLANVRVQYGATLYTALRAYHGDMTAVWDQIIGDQHNAALVEAGVLLVDH